MKRLLAAILLLAILPVSTATAKPHRSKAPKVNYKTKYVTKPYTKQKKQKPAKIGKR
jgi:hypothetical protein